MQAVVLGTSAAGALLPRAVAPFKSAAAPASSSRPLRLTVVSQTGDQPARPAGAGTATRPPRPGGPGGYRPGGPRPGGPPGGGYRSSGGRGGGGYRSSNNSDDESGGRRDFNRGGRRDSNRGSRSETLVPINENIRASEVRVLGGDKSQLGVMSLTAAIDLARQESVDVVLIVPDASPPVCRLIEYSKYKYELEKAAKDAKKKQRDAVIETKELKLRPATDVHDYQVKLRAAAKFLEKGNRVKLTLQFKGREMEFKQLGTEMFERFLQDLGEEVQVAQAPQMQGRSMNMVLEPKKLAVPV